MSEPIHPALLPAGLHDLLPPDAAHEAAVIERLVAALHGHGYDRVKPPMVEFEDTLLSGVGADLSTATFRLMDPISQRMMGVRADMTVQVARIAGSRLVGRPRPLRLCYSGQVLRVRGHALRPERQFAQVGAELIGAAVPAADAEVAVLAARALTAVGIDRLSLDLTVPPLVPNLIERAGLNDTVHAQLRHALDRKDAAKVMALGPQLPDGIGSSLLDLLQAGGPASAALATARRLSLPAPIAALIERLAAVVEMVHAALPTLTVTVDFVEHRGFEYHDGISFTVFARGVRGEIGRGGRYTTGHGETATGFSLYMDSVLRAAPPGDPQHRVFVATAVPEADRARLRTDGWQVIAALDEHEVPEAEARRLGCGHWMAGDASAPVALTPGRAETADE